MNPKAPFVHLVPKDRRKNIEFRRKILRLAHANRELQHILWLMCSHDPLFCINTFGWTYDPRKKVNRIPFITYAYQDDAILTLVKAVEDGEDALIEKSRDMGASWLCLYAFDWFFIFQPMTSFLLVSRKEDLVDKTEDPDALMWKLDFLHENLPSWLRPNVHATKLHRYNMDNGSTIDGSSTTGDVGRGGRRKACLLDEFASVDDGHAVLNATRDMTNCRLFNSTPKGQANAFYDMRENPGVANLRMHWTLHPEKAQGLYYSDEDQKYRSPWYDKQCERAAHPMEIAQELDIDYLGSDYQFFDELVLKAYRAEHIRPPYMVGELGYNEKLEPEDFSEGPKGRMQLWMYLDTKDEPPRDRKYTVAADIATGTGASNSVIVASDDLTQEKVLEFVSPHVEPYELGKIAVVIARWLGGAYMIWEANGPGRTFGRAVIESGYRNIYFRQEDKGLTPKPSDVPGWYATKENKLDLLGSYRKVLKTGEFINRSREALNECSQYVFMANGTVAHSRSANTIDPSGARENHGDRVTADALCWKATRGRKQIEKVARPVPVRSFEARRRIRRHEREEKQYW